MLPEPSDSAVVSVETRPNGYVVQAIPHFCYDVGQVPYGCDHEYDTDKV